MKKQRWTLLLVVTLISANHVYGQEPTRLDTPRSLEEADEHRRSRRPDRISTEQYERDLIKAYRTGYEDALQDALRTIQFTRRGPGPLDTPRETSKTGSGRSESDKNRDTSAQEVTGSPGSNPKDEEGSLPRGEKRKLPYQAFTGGFYAGINSTRYRGEDIDGKNLSGRLGYQVGVFTRFGGRLYGQLGVEYFTSSSNFFSPGDSLNLSDISGRINTQWIQIPVYVGYKLAQSKRGISGVRLAAGAEYANRIGGSNTVQLDNGEIQSGTFLVLGNLGFDLGPLMIDVIYHHGLSEAIKSFANSQRRSVSLNVGFKF